MLQVSPHVELLTFSYSNEERRNQRRFTTSLQWKNTSAQPLVAMEIVVLKYDAFDQRAIGERMVVTGTSSANWAPLPSGATSGDGSIGYRSEDVFTAIAYVRQVRLGDGTVWRADEARVLAELKKAAVNIRDPGSVKPDPKQSVKPE